jgi:hypothetical protein
VGPWHITATPDKRHLFVSIVNIERTLAGSPDAEVARIPLVRPDRQPARPKGSAVTAEGRYGVISGDLRRRRSRRSSVTST